MVGAGTWSYGDGNSCPVAQFILCHCLGSCVRMTGLRGACQKDVSPWHFKSLLLPTTWGLLGRSLLLGEGLVLGHILLQVGWYLLLPRGLPKAESCSVLWSTLGEESFVALEEEFGF